MTLCVALIVEAPADANTVMALVDKVLLEESGDWLDEHWLPHARTWLSLEPNHHQSAHFSLWKDVKRLWPRGRFLGHSERGRTRTPYYAAARRALQLTLGLRAQTPFNALVMVCDVDTQPQRLTGLKQAATSTSSFCVVVGAANKKREAWVLNAFQPSTDGERERLAQITQELKFDPCAEAHRLRGDARSSSGVRDVKKVLSRLVADDPARELSTIDDTELAELHARGAKTNLTAFLKDAQRLVPLLQQDPDANSQDG